MTERLVLETAHKKGCSNKLAASVFEDLESINTPTNPVRSQ